MYAFVIVKVKIFFQAFVKLHSVLKGVQVNTFVFYAFPKSFNKNIVNAAPFSVHGDFHLRVWCSIFFKEQGSVFV